MFGISRPREVFRSQTCFYRRRGTDRVAVRDRSERRSADECLDRHGGSVRTKMGKQRRAIRAARRLGVLGQKVGRNNADPAGKARERASTRGKGKEKGEKERERERRRGRGAN